MVRIHSRKVERAPLWEIFHQKSSTKSALVQTKLASYESHRLIRWIWEKWALPIISRVDEIWSTWGSPVVYTIYIQDRHIRLKMKLRVESEQGLTMAYCLQYSQKLIRSVNRKIRMRSQISKIELTSWKHVFATTLVMANSLGNVWCDLLGLFARIQLSKSPVGLRVRVLDPVMDVLWSSQYEIATGLLKFISVLKLTRIWWPDHSDAGK